MSEIRVEVRMPKLGETVAEGTISEWMKSAGDSVAQDEPLFLVETDKITTEFPSPEAGVLLEILVPVGETVPIGTVLARIGPQGSAVAALPAAVAASPAAAPQVAAAPAVSVAAASATPLPRQGGQLLSPVVRRLAAEYGLDLAQVAGTGLGGRITREDVQAALAGAPATPAPAAAAAAPRAASVSPPPAAAASVAAPGAREEVVPLSRIRLMTAERMVESRRISPHVWTSVEVDMENVAQVRARRKARFRSETGATLSYLPFIMRAVCDALLAFPPVNGSIDMASKTMVLRSYVNLGFAADLSGNGLIAPVIHDADQLNVRGLAIALKRKADAARDGKLAASDLQGSTFTLTNPPFMSYASAPIINQPNVAILATDGVARRPAVVGDAIAIRHQCILGFSYDHRAFDGVVAAGFLDHVRRSLQERDWETEIG